MRKIAWAVFILAAPGSLWGADSFTGTWKLNLNKSSFDFGRAPKEETIVVEDAGETQIRFTLTAITRDGSSTSIRADTPTEGGKGKVTEGPYDEMITKRVNQSTRDITYLRSGRVVMLYRAVMAKDGMSMKVTLLRGSDAQDRPIHEGMLFEKVN